MTIQWSFKLPKVQVLQYLYVWNCQCACLFLCTNTILRGSDNLSRFLACVDDFVYLNFLICRYAWTILPEFPTCKSNTFSKATGYVKLICNSVSKEIKIKDFRNYNLELQS